MAQPLSRDPGPGRPRGRFFVLPSEEELARATAGRIWSLVRERAAALARGKARDRRVHVALSGGGTPRRAFEYLASPPYRDGFPWESVHFWQVDERWVPEDDPRSNRRMIADALLSRIPVPADRFHPIDTSGNDPEEGARRYEARLREAFHAPAGVFPRFDLVLLGLGKDGHTASLLPGSPALAERVRWAVACRGGEPDLPRVTLTLPVLDAAAHVVFEVRGEDRAEALAAVLEGEEDLPAARVSPVQGTLTFLADADAASLAEGRR